MLRPELHRGEPGEHRALLAHPLEERIAEVIESLAIRVRAPDVDQRARISDSDARPDEEGVGQAEDGGAGRDADREGQYRCQREDWAADEQAEGVADVGCHVGHGTLDRRWVRNVSARCPIRYVNHAVAVTSASALSRTQCAAKPSGNLCRTVSPAGTLTTAYPCQTFAARKSTWIVNLTP